MSLNLQATDERSSETVGGCGSFTNQPRISQSHTAPTSVWPDLCDFSDFVCSDVILKVYATLLLPIKLSDACVGGAITVFFR